MHRDTTYLSLLGLHPSFRARITCFLFFLSLFSFSIWILLLLVQVKHKRMLYRFFIIKLEICNENNGDRNSKTQQITTEMAEYTQIILEIQ